MIRPLDRHLDGDELDALVSSLGPGATRERQLSEEDIQEAKRHVESCPDCDRRVQMHKSVQSEISVWRAPREVQAGPSCVKDSEWERVAAGLLPESETKKLMRHAAQCGYCGPLLQQAASTLLESPSSDEERILVELSSAQPEWQTEMAAVLQKDIGSRQPLKRHSISWNAPFFRWAWKGALAAMVGFGLWFGIRHALTPDAEQLLANAYTEKRTIEMRIGNAPHAALSQERGANALNSMNRPALLRAESEIAERLKSHPDDVGWLQARGRASLLENAPDAAIPALERAKQLAPTNLSIATDLATAYSERAESLSRPEDDAHAVDILGRVLAADPNDEVARFNYAIALERLSLNQQAIEQWSIFLKLHPSSGWAPEARARSSNLQQETGAHRAQYQNYFAVTRNIDESMQGLRHEPLAQLNSEVEGYLDLAIREWIPHSLAQAPSSSESRSDWTALSALAETLKSRHEDVWLEELLHSAQHSVQLRDAFNLMADVARLIDSSDNDRASREAKQAVKLFRKFDSPAGEMYAKFQLTYVDQLSHRNKECATVANELLAAPKMRFYPWLRVQAGVESAICASTSDEKAIAVLKSTVALAREHHYGKALSRTNQVLAAIYGTVGDTHEAWRTSIEGLREYWVSSLPALMGYNLLTNLDYLAEDQQEWFAQTAILKESVPMIANDPDAAMRAFEQTRLGEALLVTSDVQGAEASFRQAQSLFQSVPGGTRKDSLIAESEIGLAKVDLQRGFPTRAVGRLGGIRDQINRIPDDDLTLDFLQTYGEALFHADQQGEAQKALTSALELAENGLRLARDERARLKWSRRNEPTYRGLVELTLKTDPTRALALWEWYRGASLRGRRTRNSGSSTSEDMHDGVGLPPSVVRSALAGGSALVTFFLLDDKASVWISDARGTQQRWLSVRAEKLQILANRFAEHCSQPASSLETLRKESKALYELVILPIEPLISGHRTLLIEPDGGLKIVPFVALLNRHDVYLGDQYAIATSPGIDYLAASTAWKGLSRESRAVVVGNPTVEGSSELPDAEQEARAVGAIFSHPVLLLGNDANYQSIVSKSSGSQLFHFAGHAVANSAGAALLLSHSESLDIRHLEALQLQDNQLIVLSACSSADGSHGLFDDEDSLARRLIGMGAPEVVASRWPVDSVATADLMDNFYQRLITGGTVAEALQLAARKSRSRPGFEHPFYWAGFSVFGRG